MSPGQRSAWVGTGGAPPVAGPVPADSGSGRRGARCDVARAREIATAPAPTDGRSLARCAGLAQPGDLVALVTIQIPLTAAHDMSDHAPNLRPPQPHHRHRHTSSSCTRTDKPSATARTHTSNTRQSRTRGKEWIAVQKSGDHDLAVRAADHRRPGRGRPVGPPSAAPADAGRAGRLAHRPGRSPHRAGRQPDPRAGAGPLRADAGLAVHLLPRGGRADGRRPGPDPALRADGAAVR